jgi:hypothetical protein
MTPAAALIALPKLALGTLVHDADTDRTGRVYDTGLAEDETRVYYLLDDRGEWKADAVDVRQVEP